MVAPLLKDGSDLPCKHYPRGHIVKFINTGTTLVVEMSGTIYHMGGHCQFSISYDGVTFYVLYTIMKNCFTGTGLFFNVPIPSQLPSCNSCIFAWTWVNAIGNREFYMNCADVSIINNGVTGSFVTKNYTVLNLPGYPTVPEFPPSTYDGSDYYDNEKKITLKNDGSTEQLATPTELITPTLSTITESTTITKTQIITKIKKVTKIKTLTIIRNTCL
jgi:hypothetical protein